MKYNETVYYRDWLFSLLLLSIVTFSVLQTLSSAIASGLNAAFLSKAACLVLIIAVAYFLMTKLQIKIKVRKKGFKYKLSPFHKTSKLIPWSEIAKAELVSPSKASQLAGWSVNYSSAELTKVGFLCNSGVRLQLKDGSTLMVESITPEDLYDAIQLNLADN